MVAWENVAYELGFSSGDVNLIEGNAKQKPVAESSLDMLKFWNEADGQIQLLIDALNRLEKHSYAKQLQDGKFCLLFVTPFLDSYICSYSISKSCIYMYV